MRWKSITKGSDFMLDNLIFSLNSTMPLFFMMILGYILYRTQFLNDNFVTVANKFVYNVTLPVMLFHDLACTDIRRSFDAGYVAFCAVVTVVSILVIWLLSRWLFRDKSVVGEFVQGCYRSSAAILGGAFIQNIYGTTGMSGLMILGSVPLYNIFAVLILTLESPQEHTEPLGQKLRRSVGSIFRNPTIIAIVLGLLASYVRLPLPTMVAKAMSSLGGVTTPLALLIIGAGFKGKAALGKIGPTAVATTVKLLILPAVFLPAAIFFGFTDQKLVALLVMLGSITTPSAYVMAKQMGHDGTLTASVCAATTIFSALTLTLWLFLVRSGGYIL
jgi:predicted permease